MNNQELADRDLFNAHIGIPYFNIFLIIFIFSLCLAFGLLILHIFKCTLTAVLYHFYQSFYMIKYDTKYKSFY